jgi:2-isopropylmalate synthase
LHNDLGLSQANAIAAIDAGATVIDASVLGIGERAGICDLFSLCATLERFYQVPNFNWELARDMSQFVSTILRTNVYPHQPIIGKDVFTHVSKYHIKATSCDPLAYEALKPEQYGSVRKSILNDLSRGEQRRHSKNLQIKKPFIKGASELAYHRDGVGKRWVLMDDRVDERSSLYIIERVFDKDYRDIYQPHVDAHAHHCDSCFVFMGNQEDGSGLTVSVTFGDGDNMVTEVFSSPASVYIPANVAHSYRYVEGIGRFINIVLSSNYDRSLI